MHAAAKTPASGKRRSRIWYDRLRPTQRATSIVAAVLSAWIIAANGRPYAQEAAPELPLPAQPLAPYGDARLPVGAPARITIRFSTENPAARQHASDLARGLSEQGLDVVDLIESPGRIASSTVSYFYLEDRPGAEIAARVLGPAWKSVQQRLSAREPFPRPGALELAVAGP